MERIRGRMFAVEDRGGDDLVGTVVVGVGRGHRREQQAAGGDSRLPEESGDVHAAGLRVEQGADYGTGTARVTRSGDGAAMHRDTFTATGADASDSAGCPTPSRANFGRAARHRDHRIRRRNTETR